MSNHNAILPRLGLALVLALGFGTVLGLAVEWGWMIVNGFRHGTYISETVRLLDDGTPIIHRNEDQKITYYTLEGKETAAPKEKEALLAAHLPAPQRPTIFARAPQGSERIDGFSAPPGCWYFVHDGKIDGSGYFVGFYGRSKLCFGYLGRAGFGPDIPPAEEWFPVDGRKMGHGSREQGRVFSRAVSAQPNGYTYEGDDGEYRRPREWNEGIPSWQVAMISDDRLWLVDFREQKATVLMESPDLVSVGTFHPAEARGLAAAAVPAVRPQEWQDSQMPQLFAVRMREKIAVLDPTGKELRSYTIPAELRSQHCQFFELSDTSALLAWDRTLPDDTSRKELWWIDNAGKPVRQKELALLPDAKPLDERSEQIWVLAAAVPVPVVWVVFVFIIAPLELVVYGRVPDYGSALARVLVRSEMRLPMLAVIVLAAALAWFCYRRQRRYALGGTWAWVIFVLLTGVPGLLGYLFHRRWPVLEKCPACTHVVPHDREVCADCGTEFPPPQPKGIEVFA